MATSVSPIDPGGFLLEDYKQKVAYLTNHFSRMWMRFNFFITLETALLGGGLYLFGAEERAIMVGGGGVALSLIWYVMGAQDRYLVELYRWQVDEAGRRIANALTELTGENPATQRLKDEALAAAHDYVGSVDDNLISRFEAERVKGRRKLAGGLEALSSWRGRLFSTTRLAAWIPLMLICLWAVCLVYQLVQ